MQTLFRKLILASSWLFIAGVVTQVLLVGLVLIAGRASFDTHLDIVLAAMIVRTAGAQVQAVAPKLSRPGAAPGQASL